MAAFCLRPGLSCSRDGTEPLVKNSSSVTMTVALCTLCVCEGLDLTALQMLENSGGFINIRSVLLSVDSWPLHWPSKIAEQQLKAVRT